MPKTGKGPQEGREKREEAMPHSRRDNNARQEHAFSAYELAKKIKARKEMYNVEE